MIRRTSAILALALLAALSGAPASAQVDTGNADFSRYVAVGDSLTAAIVSGGWLDKFQVNSYPALLHRQATGGAGGFEQPLMGAPGVTPPFFLANLVPPVFGTEPGIGQPTNLFLPRPYNNLGVPGATVGDTLRTITEGGMGPHDLVLRGQGTALQQAVVQQPTFVTLFIGNNDALAAATSGVVIDGVTLTTAASFESDYRTVAGALASTGADLVFFTIPEVTVIPFVTTIPPVVVDPATNQPVQGPNGLIPLIGPNGPLALNDHVLLTAGSLLARGIGVPRAVGGTGQPLPTQVVLDAAETATISSRVAAFNATIRQAAADFGALLFDFNGLFNRIAAEGAVVGGVDYTSDFLSGGFFSYDGVHATPFGYAFLANELIKAINQNFDAHIPQVGLGPFVFGEFQLDPRAALFQAATASSRTVLTEDALGNLRYLGMEIPKFTVATGGETPAADEPTGGDEATSGDGDSGNGGAATGGRRGGRNRNLDRD
ncbi:MAG: hypothetical protein KDD47_16455 [Acidobacteria bacterium]|nr:hypothetical protein [Acidobacteriota bacterium]